jgi:phenylacetate-CoA ligase
MGDSRYFEPEVELMPRSDIEALQEQKILELVPYAYERSALYRSVWDAAGVHPRDIKTLADFRERVPFITKDSVREFRDRTGDPFGGLLCVERDELSAVMSSSGSTGDATFFAESFSRWAPLTTGYMRDLWEQGLRPGDHVIPTAPTFRGGSYDDMRQLGCIAVAVDATPGSWSAVLDAVEKYEVRYLQLLGPMMAELERLSDGRDMKKALESVKFLSFAGEPLGSRAQSMVRDTWDTRLAMWTSAGDTGTAWQCREYDGFHLWEDTVYPEVLHADQKDPVAEGEVGELTVTDIDNLVAPLIRYRAEDLVRYSSQVCGCGRTHGRIWPLGRTGDLTIVQDKGIMPFEVWAILEQLEETRAALFQIVRPERTVDELRIRVGYAPGRTANVDELNDLLVSKIASVVGVAPILELVEEEVIISRASSAAKIPRVVKA